MSLPHGREFQLPTLRADNAHPPQRKGRSGVCSGSPVHCSSGTFGARLALGRACDGLGYFFRGESSFRVAKSRFPAPSVPHIAINGMELLKRAERSRARQNFSPAFSINYKLFYYISFGHGRSSSKATGGRTESPSAKEHSRYMHNCNL